LNLKLAHRWACVLVVARAKGTPKGSLVPAFVTGMNLLFCLAFLKRSFGLGFMLAGKGGV